MRKTLTERCVICREPVRYEGDTYCYDCGRRSELEDTVLALDHNHMGNCWDGVELPLFCVPHQEPRGACPHCPRCPGCASPSPSRLDKEGR